MISKCNYCNNNTLIVNKITTYCYSCDMVYIKDHSPYSLYEDYLYYSDKYEEQSYK